jgi:hypothetical protein
MGRPAKARFRAPADIEEEIAREAAQHAALQSDLRDALLAGENTAPYREAIAAIGEKILSLRTTLEAGRQADEGRRLAVAAEEVGQIVAEAERRHAALLEGLQVPSTPQI